MRFTDAARRVIELGWAIWEYWERELPKRHPNYPLVNPGEDDGPPPPEEAELRDFLRGLPTDYVYRLLTLLDVGRERFGPREFEARAWEARAELPDPADAIEVLIASGALAAVLGDGLDFAAQDGVDLDAPAGAAA